MDWGKLLLKVVDIAKNHLDSSKNNDPSTQQHSTQRPVHPTVEREKTDAEWKSYFKEILLSEFPSYTIRENVKVTDLVGFVSDEAQL